MPPSPGAFLFSFLFFFFLFLSCDLFSPPPSSFLHSSYPRLPPLTTERAFYLPFPSLLLSQPFTFQHSTPFSLRSRVCLTASGLSNEPAFANIFPVPRKFPPTLSTPPDSVTVSRRRRVISEAKPPTPTAGLHVSGPPVVCLTSSYPEACCVGLEVSLSPQTVTSRLVTRLAFFLLIYCGTTCNDETNNALSPLPFPRSPKCPPSSQTFTRHSSDKELQSL